MHGLIRKGLEEYLRGAPRRISLEIEQHLRECEECREEVSWMQEQVHLLRLLAPEREVEPSPGFYARVLERIEAQQGNSIWNAFLDPIFGRRLAATSLTMALLLAGYLAFSEVRNPPVAFAPEAVMVVQGPQSVSLGVDRQRDREHMLVTLATYRD